MKALILSMHKSYDYRIYRHIRMLLSLGSNVYYLNITNETSPDPGIWNNKFVYIPLHVKDKKSLISIIKTYFRARKIIEKINPDFVFIQDPLLLLLFIGKPLYDSRKITLDFHELFSEESLLTKLTSVAFLPYVNSYVITAMSNNKTLIKFLHKFHKKVFVFENYPLLSDFIDVSNDESKTDKAFHPCRVGYIGMLTEEQRQTIKMLSVFQLLLEQRVSEVEIHVAGSIANRKGKEEIISRINDLSSRFPDKFIYHGALSRRDVTLLWKKLDIHLSLYSLDDSVSISPNKLFEALAAGVVYITDHFQIEGIKNTGSHLPVVLVQKKDSHEKIAQVINDLCEDREKLINLKKKSRLFITNNNLFWEQYEDYYRLIFGVKKVKT